MGPIDYLLLVLIAAAAFFALRRMRKNKGSCSCGNGACSGNCAACGACSSCAKKKDT